MLMTDWVVIGKVAAESEAQTGRDAECIAILRLKIKYIEHLLGDKSNDIFLF